MRVAQVNTNTFGGAAIVARRLHEALLVSEIESSLVTKNGAKGYTTNHHFLKDARITYFLRKTLSNSPLLPLAKYIKNMRKHRNLLNQPKGYELFSPIDSSPLGKQFNIFERFDIIHFHWINDFINLQLFFKKFDKKKFVWTLHDMNPVTGGCHHSDGCMRFTTGCRVCPQLEGTIDPTYSHAVLSNKVESLADLKTDQLVIVSPSEWLTRLSQASPITGRFRHLTIPNPSFHPSLLENRKLTRSTLQLPAGKKIVLFASDNIKNPRKGIQTLFRAIELMPQKNQILLVGVGNGSGQTKGLDTLYTGHINDPRLLANYYFAADVLVVPSKAENSPLVIIEALSCGTPVIAAAVGGIPELITSANGLLFEPDNALQLSRQIQTLLFEEHLNRNEIKSNATIKHHPEKVMLQYHKVYKQLLNKS